VLDDCDECGGDNSSCAGCTDSSAWNYDSTATLDDNSCYYTPFGEEPDTDCNATILIPADANITIDGNPLSNGSWIGVFYTDADGNLSFGGGIQWNSEVTSIAAWGTEAGLDNGFQSGEEYTWAVYDTLPAKVISPVIISYTAHVYSSPD
jgi:hypothetical protein